MRPLLTTLLTLLLAVAGFSAHAGKLTTVFAAASLRDVLEAAAADYQKSTGQDIRLVFAASSVLARQIDAGAPAEIYISANREWIDWLASRDIIKAGETVNVAGNQLVVAFPAGSKPPQKLDGMLTMGRFAMGDPSHVPAGRYAKTALENLNIWDIVRPYAVHCENVRVALEFLRRGEVSAAIVYASDMKVAPELVRAYAFPADSHSPIAYFAAPLASGNLGSKRFLDFLTGPDGQALFARFGFSSAG
ncbi:MAG: molybdate ABC transporter substrate-binding protein [Rhizobiaceae bacterium]